MDDHQVVRQTMCAYLTMNGFELLYEDTNGQDLLSQLASAEVLSEACVLAINMSVMDGFETALQLSNRYPKIRILAYSTNDSTSRVEQILNCGAHGFVLKLENYDLRDGLRAICNGEAYIALDKLHGNWKSPAINADDPRKLPAVLLFR